MNTKTRLEEEHTTLQITYLNLEKGVSIENVTTEIAGMGKNLRAVLIRNLSYKTILWLIYNYYNIIPLILSILKGISFKNAEADYSNTKHCLT